MVSPHWPSLNRLYQLHLLRWGLSIIAWSNLNKFLVRYFLRLQLVLIYFSQFVKCIYFWRSDDFCRNTESRRCSNLL
ncbi:hypothetical protein Dda3937_04506 [Dickeya dadantii 3937]|uniref:Uncharacterized protein n=1 Tax=Dickeya dadantii (strain 3937) TaxID=198628 RepID=E0SFT7_DICD3|nr:hypothetical protein Dda3937_04506 [Dickeya dadantii 3937]